jgi:hypothetical protein
MFSHTTFEDAARGTFRIDAERRAEPPRSGLPRAARS